MEPLGRSAAQPKIEEAKPPKTKPVKPPLAERARQRPPTPPVAPQFDQEAMVETPPSPAEIGPKLSSRKYTVLLGAFGKPENAQNLKNRLEAAGLPVAISEVTEKNKLWFRVMSGTFDDKDSAEAYCRELRQRKLVDRPYVKPL
jgi:cell division protein FtsN